MESKAPVSIRRLLWFILALSILLDILHYFCTFVSLIWLLVLGEWWAMAAGIFGAVAAILFIPVALSEAFMKRGGLLSLSGLLFFLTVLFNYVVTIVWCGGVLWYFSQRITQANAVPLLLWAYAVAYFPWLWLSSREMERGGGGIGTTVYLAFVNLACIVTVALMLVVSMPYPHAMTVFCLTVLAAIAINCLRLHFYGKLSSSPRVTSSDHPEHR